MTVAELVKRLLEMPQDLPVFIKDADEGCLLRLDPDDVDLREPDKTYGYSFARVEVGSDYLGGDGDDRRVDEDVNNLP